MTEHEAREESRATIEQQLIHRLAETHAAEIRAVAERVDSLESAHHSLQIELAANTRVTASIKEDTADLVAFTKTANSLVTLARWVGKLLSWLAPIAAVVLGVWATIKGVKS